MVAGGDAERSDDLASGARPDPEVLVVGHVTKPHGTKGEVFVWPLTDSPDQVFAPGTEMLLGNGEGHVSTPESWVQVGSQRPFKRGVLVRFEGYGDRTAVEPLAGRYLLVPIERLEPLREDEVFYHQLLGLRVVTKAGDDVGVVREVYETEPAPLLEVRGDGKVHLIPFTRRVVRNVDPDGGQLVIQPPAGLLDV